MPTSADVPSPFGAGPSALPGLPGYTALHVAYKSVYSIVQVVGKTMRGVDLYLRIHGSCTNAFPFSSESTKSMICP